MNETFKIYVHRLRDGQTEKISETVPPDFLEIHEAELAFNAPVVIQGEASAADESLVLRLHVETEATMPCVVCNKDVQVKISIPDLCYAEDFENIKGAVFNYQDVVREEILLALPFVVECNQGDCPERSTMAKYFTK